MKRSVSRWRFLFLVLTGTAAGALFAFGLRSDPEVLARVGLSGLITFAHACEIVFAVYAACFTIAAIRYWRLPLPVEGTKAPAVQPAAGGASLPVTVW